MGRSFLRLGTSLALGLSGLGVSAPASAVIYDIPAASASGIEVTLAAGQYLIKWVGIADGGAYNAAGGISVSGAGGAVGFSNAFTGFNPADNPANFNLDIFTTGTVYASEAASLAAYTAGTGISRNFIQIVNGLPVLASFGTNGLLPFPWIGNLASGGTARLIVLDSDGTRTNNTGGVSLSIELIQAAVPEPASWAMMLVGFGMAGGALRRRKRQTLRVTYA